MFLSESFREFSGFYKRVPGDFIVLFGSVIAVARLRASWVGGGGSSSTSKDPLGNRSEKKIKKKNRRVFLTCT